MKIIIFSLALMMFLAVTVRAEEDSSALKSESEIVNDLVQQNSIVQPDKIEDFDILAPPYWPGGNPGGGRWPIIPCWYET